MGAPSVWVAVDHPVTRRGIVGTLAGAGVAVVDSPDGETPTTVVADERTVASDDAGVRRALRHAARIVVLAEHPLESFGASISARDIRVLSAGVSPEELVAVVTGHGRDRRPAPSTTPALSARERDVLTLYVAGQTAKDIAASLGLSVHTVHEYVRRARVKYRRAGRPAESRIDLYRRWHEDHATGA